MISYNLKTKMKHVYSRVVHHRQENAFFNTKGFSMELPNSVKYTNQIMVKVYMWCSCIKKALQYLISI